MSNQQPANSHPASFSQNRSNNQSNNPEEYRPQSPDLNTFIAQRQQSTPFKENTQNHSHFPAADAPTVLTGLPGGVSFPHRGSYDASPYFSPQGSFSAGGLPTGYFPQQGAQSAPRRDTYAGAEFVASPTSPSPRFHSAPEGTGRTNSLGPGSHKNSSYQPYQPPGPRAPWPSAFDSAPDIWQNVSQPIPEEPSGPQAHVQDSQPSHFSSLPLDQPAPMPGRRKRVQQDETDDSADASFTPPAGVVSKSTRRKAKTAASVGQVSTMRDPDDLGPSLGIEVKTKFPVARIKRIMQADEDVGKVAQAAPTAVSKALELFMITLVTKAANEAKDRGSKRVTAAHLKQAVVKDETFDFLAEIIEKIQDPTEKKGSGTEGEEGAGKGKGKRKRVARKKKSESDEE